MNNKYISTFITLKEIKKNHLLQHCQYINYLDEHSLIDITKYLKSQPIVIK